MSDFWAQRLGRTPQQAAPAPAPVAPAPTQPWWQTPQPQVQQPVAPTPQLPAAVPQQAVQPTSVAPAEGATFSDMLGQTEYHSDKAQSTKDNESCPNCGSTNYMRASGHPNSMKQCFECGNNPRFEQMASGISGAVKTQGPVRAARVQNPDIGAPKMGSIFQHIG